MLFWDLKINPYYLISSKLIIFLMKIIIIFRNIKYTLIGLYQNSSSKIEMYLDIALAVSINQKKLICSRNMIMSPFLRRKDLTLCVWPSIYYWLCWSIIIFLHHPLSGRKDIHYQSQYEPLNKTNTCFMKKIGSG